MFTHHLKTALRFLKQNRIFAGINALGLSVALAASFIMLLYAINELSYDHFHKNRNRVCRVLNYYVNFKKTIPYTPYILAPTLKEEFPQVEKAISVSKIRDFKIKFNEEFLNVPDAISADPELFDIFTLPLTGNSTGKNLLDDPNSLVLSQELAEKIFGKDDPIGKQIEGFLNDQKHIFTISGIIKNIPKNSTFRAQCLMNRKWSIESANLSNKVSNADKDWDLDMCTTWVLLSKKSADAPMDQQFLALEKKYIREVPDKHYSFQKLSDVYLGSQDVLYSETYGNVNNIRMFSVIAFLIIMVAAMNYIILSTAVSTGRAKEIGIRKTAGAGKRNIRTQLLNESILLAFLVLPIALLMMWFALPYAGKLFQTDLSVITSNIFKYVALYLGLTFLIGLASGVYTSYYLSRIRVTEILKNSIHSGRKKQFFRSSLIVLQLVIFCSFVSGTLIIRSQYQYALKTDPGFYTDNILLVDIGNNIKAYPAFISSIKSNPDVIAASGTGESLPLGAYSGYIVNHYQNKDVKVPVQGLYVDYNFLNTMGLTLIKGRDFSLDFGSDGSKKALILNETAVKEIGIPDPVGKPLGRGTIIGVVKDFNTYSIRSKIPPVSISLTDNYIHKVVVHYKSGRQKELINYLKEEWRKIVPDSPPGFSTMEENLINTYSSERNLSTIVSIFALFTLFIAAIGLYALTLFISRSRTKEIGIRKVFGSSERSIIYSFLEGNFVLVLSASILSVPVSLFVMTNWLEDFSYKVHISWWVFVIPFVISVIVVLSTILVHSWKASRINPVKALRYE